MNAFVNYYRFNDRIFVSDINLRRKLTRYAKGGEQHGKKYLPLLSEDEKNDMFSTLEGGLKEFLMATDDNSCRMPLIYQSLLLSLASGSAVAAYVHPNDTVGKLMGHLINGNNIKDDFVKWNSLHVQYSENL